MTTKLYDFAATLVHETDRAYYLDHGGSESSWFPKSLTQDNGDGSWTAPEWLCEEKGVV